VFRFKDIRAEVATSLSWSVIVGQKPRRDLSVCGLKFFFEDM